MTSIGAILQLIGIPWESEGRRLLKQSGKSREALVAELSQSQSEAPTLPPSLPERRVHPDDTCPGDRRRNHLRPVS